MRHLGITAHLRPYLAMILFVALASTGAWGFRDGRDPGRFDEFEMHREGRVIAVAPVDVDAMESDDPARTGWDRFRNGQGGRWRVYLDERTGVPTLVSGAGAVWFRGDEIDGLTLEGLEARARSFFETHAALLGGGSAGIELDLDASRELRPGTWQAVFRRSADGVRVENSRFEFHVDDGRLTMFGGSRWAAPTVGGIPAIDARTARDVLDAYLGVATDRFDAVAEPELALVAVDPVPAADRPRSWHGPRGEGLGHLLVWRIRFQVPGESPLWTGEIDAHRGTMTAFYDDAHYTAIRGGVFPVSPDGDCAGGGCEIAGFPMPFVDYSEAGLADAFSDPFGEVVCGDPDAGFVTNLFGTYVRVRDECGAVAESGSCDGGAELGLKAGENCDVEFGASAGNTAAARSGYYHINRAAEVARFYDPGNPWLEGTVTLNSNIRATCNASWDGEVNMYRAGDGCGNTGEIQGVVVHEWGHGYDQNDGGGFDNTSEAYADVVGVFAARDSCMGRGFYSDGRVCSGYGDTCLTCTGIRDHDWASRTENTPATPQGFVQDFCPGGGGPCGFAGHCETYPIVEAVYDLATRDLPAAGMDVDTAWQLAERLWYETRSGSGGDIFTCALPSSDSCGASTWYQRMRAADDDDGDLGNGTPHAAELYAAFARHNIACGLADDPENQSSSSCPTLTAPALVTQVTPGGTELSWNAVAGASGYVVYRGELGCSRQQVPVADLVGGETTWVDTDGDPDVPRFYRVEAVGSNRACRSALSSCEAAPFGPRLQKLGHRFVEQGANVNFNGFADPGETVRVPISLFNAGVADATSVAGTLRAVDPAAARVLTPSATWNDIPVDADAESLDPHFELTVFENVACGDGIELELDMQAAGTVTRTGRFRIPFGVPDRDYDASLPYPVSIPSVTTVPFTTTIEITENRTVADLDVSVFIQHFAESDLVVDLTSPDGTMVRLHDRTDVSGFGLYTRFDAQRAPDGPGTMAGFAGESLQGTWTLTIEDQTNAFAGGTLQGWTLHATVSGPFDCDAFPCPEPSPAEAVTNLVVDRTTDGGDGSIDLTFGWDTAVGVAGYHVLESTAPGFDGIVDLTGRTGGTTSLVVEDGAATASGLTFYVVRAVNGCNHEGP